MIVALSYDFESQSQARSLIQWLARMGTYPEHTFLAFVERNATGMIADLVPLFADTQEIEYVDHLAHYPESKNLAFQQAAGYVANQYPSAAWWLYLEPDAVPTRASFLNEIEAAARAAAKPFLGSLVPASTAMNTQAHMGAVGVYPVNLVKYGAGDALNAHEVPFPAAIAAATVRTMQPTTLIVDDWEGKGLPEGCALYHPDRDGKILAILATVQQVVADDNLPVPVLAEPEGCALTPSDEARESTNQAPLEISGDSRGGQIFPEDVVWLEDPNPKRFEVKPDGEIVPVTLAATNPTWCESPPWESRLQSEEDVKYLVEKLKTYCNGRGGTRYVRKALKKAKVV